MRMCSAYLEVDSREVVLMEHNSIKAPRVIGIVFEADGITDLIQ